MMRQMHRSLNLIWQLEYAHLRRYGMHQLLWLRSNERIYKMRLRIVISIDVRPESWWKRRNWRICKSRIGNIDAWWLLRSRRWRRRRHGHGGIDKVIQGVSAKRGGKSGAQGFEGKWSFEVDHCAI